jgi:hypothetical protein
LLYGVGSAFAFVPLLPVMQSATFDGKGRSRPGADEHVAGVFNGCYYLGELVGQLFGVTLVAKMGWINFSKDARRDACGFRGRLLRRRRLARRRSEDARAVFARRERGRGGPDRRRREDVMIADRVV